MPYIDAGAWANGQLKVVAGGNTYSGQNSQAMWIPESEYLQMVEDQKNRVADAEAAAKAAKDAEATAENANKYLAKWDTILGESKQMFGAAGADIDAAMTDVRGLSSVADRIRENADQFSSDFAGTQNELRGLAGEEIAQRRELMGTFGETARYDPNSAANKAMADVSIQAQGARESLAREMAREGRGGSGASKESQRKSFLDEALGRVGQASVAREGEKLRAGQLALSGLQTIDPTSTIALSTDIAKTANDMYSQYGDIMTDRADLLTSLSTARGGLATNLATAIAEPYGQLGGAMFGYSQQAKRDARAPGGTRISIDDPYNTSFFHSV